jgi:hypothetical protein
MTVTLPSTADEVLATTRAVRKRLGTSWTALHLMFEQQAADILGIPFDEWTQGRPRDRGLHAGHRLQAGEARAARDGRVVERLELPGL